MRKITFFVLTILLTIGGVQAQAMKKPRYEFYKSTTSAEALAFVHRTEYSELFEEYMERRYEYYSSDGKTFNRVMQSGSSSGGGSEEVSFYIPETEIQGEWLLKDGATSLTIDGKLFKKVVLNPMQLQFLDYPKIRQIYSLLQAQDGTYIMVTHDRYAVGRGVIKLFVGPANAMQELKITGSNFTMCGAFSLGTTEGSLRYHTSDVADTNPSMWKGKLLKHVDESEFSLQETGSTAKIIRK